MKNKPNFFFDNRGFPNWGVGGGRCAAWEFFLHNPIFVSDNVPNFLLLLITLCFIENSNTEIKMLENRPEDELVKLVKTVEIVKTVETAETI